MNVLYQAAVMQRESSIGRGDVEAAIPKIPFVSTMGQPIGSQSIQVRTWWKCCSTQASCGFVRKVSAWETGLINYYPVEKTDNFARH